MCELSSGPENEEVAAEMKALLILAKTVIKIHRLPPVGLGVLHSGLKHTMHAYAHALRLECSNWTELASLVKCFFSCCADRGTESNARTVINMQVG